VTQRDQELTRQGAKPPAPLRILIVEDNAMIANLIGDTLEAMGHEICAIVSTEDEAVSAAALQAPDLLLVDANLQVGGGVAAVRRILLDGPLPHIFMTGDTFLGNRLDADAIILHKPFQDHDLARAIKRAMTQDRAGLVQLTPLGRPCGPE
jgi:CheY-like chemotaxis protein